MDGGCALVSQNGRAKVVVIGAGFAGWWAARAAARGAVDVTILDRNNYHTFLPLLYQVAAAEVEPEEIVYPVRSMMRPHRNIYFALADVDGVDLDSKIVTAGKQQFDYDYLVIASGSRSNFLGIKGAEEHSFPLKSLEQGGAIRNRILCCFERASLELDPDVRRRILTFAIVGGGPTGVEYAGALSELIRGPLMKDYKSLSPNGIRIVLVEALPTLLQGLPESLSSYADRRLQRMGVDVRIGAKVSEVTPDRVLLADGSEIATDTAIWTAGVRGEALGEKLGLPLARGGRVAVTPELQIPGHPEVYVAGDLAYVEQDGKPLPMVAPVAMQQGTCAGRNIAQQAAGLDAAPFRYHDKGTLATIGRNAAVAEVAGRTFTGFPAWVLWVMIHILYLIGFRNRIFVLLNWAWDYFLYERTVRLILPGSQEERRRC
jgi:NADH:ubiquinone reductase (H+-translocating)